MSRPATSHPAAGRSHWPVIAAFVLVTSANQMLWLTFAPVTTAAARHYGVSEGAVGALSAVFPLLYVVLAIPAGFALDRWFRPSIVLGAVLTAAGSLLRLGGDSFAWALAGQLVVAVAQPLVTNSVAKLAVAYTRDEDRAVGIAVCSAGLFAGFLLAFGSGAALGGGTGLRTLLVVQAAYAVAGAVLLTTALRIPGRVVEGVAGTAMTAVRAVWDDRVLRATIELVVVGFGVFVGLTTWLQALLEPAGTSADTAGLLLVVMVLAGVVGAAVLPPLAARRGIERATLLATLAVTAAGSLLLTVEHAPYGVGAVLAGMGLLLLATLPIVLEVVERRAGAMSGTAAGLLWMAGNAGGLVVTLLVAPLLERPAVAFTVFAAVALCGVPVLRRLDPAELRAGAP